MATDVQIKNKRALFDFELTDKLIAGIQLKGTEIKSLREGKASLADAFCFFTGHEMFIRNMHIAEYTHGSYANHEPRRIRKLLLGKKELKKWQARVTEKGFTVVPVRLFINEKGLAKLEIALARGKKMYDKRHAIRDREQNRELDRERKNK